MVSSIIRRENMDRSYSESELLDLYKNSDDEAFVKILFLEIARHYKLVDIVYDPVLLLKTGVFCAYQHF